MALLSDPQVVAEQYRNDERLSSRIKLHAKHSTAPVPFMQWCFSQYDFRNQDRILELGCGNAAQWDGHADALPDGAVLVLSDLSPGMVDTVWQKMRRFPRVLAQTADIQALPFPAASFDRVIANHMLYHVPNLPAALGEVSRVLQPDGVFYCTTMGEHGLTNYLHRELRHVLPELNAFGETYSFTLQNGAAQLQPFFQSVRLALFEDSLHITDTQDLVDWIVSAPSLTLQNIRPDDIAKIYDYFEGIRLRDGAIRIPKEAGMFLCRR